MILGEITFRRRGPEPVKATLTDDSGWQCRDKLLERKLNRSFPLEGWWLSPSMGQLGAALLHEVAKAIGGEAEYLAPIPPHNPNVIY